MSWFSVVRVIFLAIVAVLFCWSMLAILFTGPVVVRVAPVGINSKISISRLRRTVETLCTEFVPRDYLHAQNLDRAAAWIAAEFRESGLSVELQEYEIKEGFFKNVIARRQGTDPSAGAIVIGAHYDAYREFPGADDNASGVAVLLELARTLPADQSLHQTLLFVAFSTEEPPFFSSEEMGSFVFASRLKKDKIAVDLMIALDLVGYFSDAPGSQHFPHPLLRQLYPDRGDFVAVIGDLRAGSEIERVKRGMLATESLPVHSFRAPAWLAPIDLSDHVSFRKLGLPGVLVTDTAFMRYPYYHTREDTPDKLDYERMGLLVRALHGVLLDRVGPTSGRESS